MKLFKASLAANFKEGITKCSNEINNKLIGTRQHSKYLLEYIGYMFRTVNRSSSGLQQSKSQMLFRYCDPNIFTVVKYITFWYWIKCETYNVQLKQVKTLVGIWLFGKILPFGVGIIFFF